MVRLGHGIGRLLRQPPSHQGQAHAPPVNASFTQEALWMHPPAGTAACFRRISADKAGQYRAILDVFAAAKRPYRLQLRPDEVLAEATWPGAAPTAEELAAELAQFVTWGNLEAQPDIARVTRPGRRRGPSAPGRRTPHPDALSELQIDSEAVLAALARWRTGALADAAGRRTTGPQRALSRWLRPDVPAGSPVAHAEVAALLASVACVACGEAEADDENAKTGSKAEAAADAVSAEAWGGCARR
jgi:Protein of unknown function (DUF2397)